MTTIVGVDLRGKSEGALKMAAWLDEHPTMTCVHVLRDREANHHKTTVRESAADLAESKRKAVENMVKSTGGIGGFHVDLRTASCPSDGLVEGLSSSDLLVVGRDRRRLLPHRLGVVTRNVLRKTACPTIIAPPDLSIADGPIVVATTCDDAGSRALAFARSVAEHRARPIVAIRALQLAFNERWTALSSVRRAVQEECGREIAEERERLRTWALKEGMAPQDAHLVASVSSPLKQILAFADQVHALMLVSAPHSKSYLQELVGKSFGAKLAARAKCPVALC